MIDRVKCWAVVIALAGCDHVFQLDTVRTHADAAADAATFSCPAPVLADDFTGTEPCAPWGSFFPANKATASEGNHELTFHFPPGAEARCESPANVALPTGGVAVRFKVLPAGQQAYMTLESGALGAQISVQAGRLLFQPNNGSPYASLQYDALAMQYVRLTPDTSTHTITAAYSADAIAWTMMAGTAPLPAAALVDIQLKAGALNTGSSSVATFEHLIACP